MVTPAKEDTLANVSGNVTEVHNTRITASGGMLNKLMFQRVMQFHMHLRAVKANVKEKHN